MRRARCEQRLLVGEVPVDGRAADTGRFRDRRDRRLGRADPLVEGNGALRDAAPRLGLELCSAHHPVGAFFVGHKCSLNIDRSNQVCNRFRAPSLFTEKERLMELTAIGPRIVTPSDGLEGFLGSIGVRFMIDGAETGERFSLVEHPMSPRALAAPLHLHTREDEYSYVLEGTVGALLGDDVVIGKPGDLIFKPRGQWHTFWNAGDEPARLLEIISPAGFERFFAELVELGGAIEAPPDALADLCVRYDLDMRPDTVPDLLERFGLAIGQRP